MPRQTYFIDPLAGDGANDGISEARPRRHHSACAVRPGDTVLFKRGSVMREALIACEGTPGEPVTYGAYGVGEDPLFLGSMALDEATRWVEDRPNVWRYTGEFPSEICNLVFNDGASCGTLRWSLAEVREPGDWYYSGIGDTCAAEGNDSHVSGGKTLYLFASANPTVVHASIEGVLWGLRRLVTGQRHLVFEHLAFRNSGVHGYQACAVTDVTIRFCDFRRIGGAVWNRERRIRFGNAIEMWDGATDITVEDCTFDDIYDSGVTHQGGETRNIPRRLRFVRNTFSRCGMGAYECREPSSDVSFEYNTCLNAGGGFSHQGEILPRQSEIHPEPMGHHIFIWRIDPGTQVGAVHIRHNTFSEAPHGSAIFSIIDPKDERWFVIDHNRYQQTVGTSLIRWGGRDYAPAEFQRYQTETGQDRHSTLVQA